MPRTALTYTSFDDLGGRPHVVVDGPATVGTTLCLSHWPGTPELPEPLRDDLSAQMAFRYLDHPEQLHGDAGLVSNNHFDQDGLVGLFALIDPDAATDLRALVIDLAAAGDFGTYRFRDAARASMAVSAFTDPDRSPFGPLPSSYDEQTTVLYESVLPQVTDLVTRPERWRDLWADEDAQLTASEAALQSGEIDISERPDVDLAVATVHGRHDWSGHRFGGRTFEGVHPMALHNATDRSVLALLMPDGRVSVTHRYETWVTYRSRRRPPRVDWAPLADELAAEDDVAWLADPVDDLTPSLRAVGGTALSPDKIIDAVARHLRDAPTAFDAFAGGRLADPVT
jgi:hypothetical protein